MFIREVIKSKKGSSKKFVYHLLVESYRSPKGPRQRTLLSLGKLELPRQQWKALANRIEEIISGQLSFSEPVGEEIESWPSIMLSYSFIKNLIKVVPNPLENPTWRPWT